MALKKLSARTDLPLQSAKPRWVLWWAAVGAVFFAIWIYVFIAWFASGDATPTPTGPDPVPTHVKVWVWIFQIASLLVALAAVIYAVRTTKKEGRLSFDAILLIGWVAVWWQDPIINYIRPQFFYNAYEVNLGAWASWIPGWVSPNGSKLPESLLVTGSAYFYVVFTAVLFCYVLRRMKDRWPHLGKVTLMLVGFAVLALFDFALEYPFVRTRVYAYPGTIHALSLHGGKWYQFPLYEPLLAAFVWTVVAALRYFRDDKGHSWVERGIDRVGVSQKTKSLVRVLAVAGFINVALFVTYCLPYQAIGLHIDKFPEYPSYQRAGICGPGTGYECPDPMQPIPLRGVAPQGT